MEGGGGNGGLGRRRWERFALPFLVDGWMDGKSGHPHAVMGCCVPTTTSSLPSSVPPSFSPPTASIIPSDAPSFSAATSVPPPGISTTHFPIAQRISFGTIPLHLNPGPWNWLSSLPTTTTTTQHYSTGLYDRTLGFGLFPVFDLGVFKSLLKIL